jgi:UPF0271 protein
VDPVQARAVVEAAGAYGLPLLTLPDSVAASLAAASGVVVFTEAFADRAYTAVGTLVPRREEGAVVTDPDAVVQRSVGIAGSGSVVAHDGRLIAVRARSLCLHGDTPGAAELARRVRSALEAAGVRVEAFA